MPGGYEQAKNEFFKEMKVFQMVNHPNLVQVNTFDSKELLKIYIKMSMYILMSLVAFDIIFSSYQGLCNLYRRSSVPVSNRILRKR